MNQVIVSTWTGAVMKSATGTNTARTNTAETKVTGTNAAVKATGAGNTGIKDTRTARKNSVPNVQDAESSRRPTVRRSIVFLRSVKIKPPIFPVVNHGPCSPKGLALRRSFPNLMGTSKNCLRIHLFVRWRMLDGFAEAVNVASALRRKLGATFHCCPLSAITVTVFLL